jgi:integrase
MTSLPTYLYQYKQSKNYYFRIRQRSLDQMGYDIPSDYFVASLRTDNVHDAAFLALYVVTQLKKEIMNMDIHTPQSLGGGELVVLSQDSMDELTMINTHITSRKQLKTRFTRALGVGKMMLSHGAIDVDNFDGRELQRAQILQGMPTVSGNPHSPSDVCINEQRMLSALVIRLCEHAQKVKNFSDEEDPFDANMFDCLNLSTLQQKYQQLTSDIDVAESVDKEVVSIPSQVKKQHYSIEQMFALFKKEKSGAIRKGSIKHYDISFEFLSELVSLDDDISILTNEFARKVKFSLIERKDKRVKLDGGKTLSVSRINSYLSNLSTFCQWCIDHKVSINQGANPFQGLRVKATKNSKIPRREFTVDEANAIFDYQPTDKREAKEFRDDAYWFPKIGLYSGMRLNETSELLISDVNMQEDIWCFDLRGSHLKTCESPRLIPVHSKLIESGFIEYVRKKKEQGEKFLFEQIRLGKKEAGKYGRGEKISRWYNRSLLKNIGVDKTYEKEERSCLIDYHCLRHTFVYILKQRGVDMSYIKALVGHSGQLDLTRDVYGHNANPIVKNLQIAIENISFDE